MLINSEYHINLFRQLVETVEAYRRQGLKCDPIKVATVLDEPRFAAAWGINVWTMDDISCGTANLDIMEKFIEGGPNSIRSFIYESAQQGCDIVHAANNGPIIAEMPDD